VTLDLERLFFSSLPPIASSDLGRGARLVVPRGAAFGVPQLVRHGVFWDWVRDEPDRYWVAGDRTSSHAGVDLGFFARDGRIYAFPEGLPVRAIAAGRVAWTGKKSDPESKHGVVLDHGGSRRLFLYSHYADVREIVRPGEKVERGQVIGHAGPFSREFPVVLVHFAIGLYVRGWGNDPLDPTALLKRWRVRQPLHARTDALTLNRGGGGVWRGPGRIEGQRAVGKLGAREKDVYR
jgi:murein DD-endopeptidase MepM/ murein hydrolase activator NlpD